MKPKTFAYPSLFVALAIILAACSTAQVTGLFSRATPTPFPPWYPSTNPAGDPIGAVYSNRIPCAECDLPLGPSSKIKVELVLYEDPQTHEPTTYALARVYPDAKGPSDRMETYGAWTIGHGTKSDPDALLYELDANSPPEFRSYLVLSDDILFILDAEGNPKVGDGFYSYTLNRTH